MKTHIHAHTRNIKKKKSYTLARRSKAPSLSPHLLPANATGLQAEFTCLSHTSTRTHKHSDAPTFHLLRVTKV